MIQSLTPKATPKNIIVVGAGLAGLSAAFELSHGGHKVTVLETKSQPGGRVCTLRQPFSDGLYAELGGEYFYPTTPDFALAYIQYFGLEVLPLLVEGQTAITYLRNQRQNLSPHQTIPWPLELAPEEQELGSNGLRQRYLWEPHKKLFQTPSASWSYDLLDPYDAHSFTSLLKESGASPAAIELLRLLDFDFIGEEAEKTSALELIGDRAKFSQFRQPFYAINGGNDILPHRLAESLPVPVQYGTTAVKIEHSLEGITVEVVQHNTKRTVRGDYLILALPFSVLKHIPIVPELSPNKTQVIHSLPYSSVCRVYFQTGEKFWQKEGINGFGFTDLPINYFWESSWRQNTQKGILQAYASGITARAMAHMEDRKRKSFALDQAQKVFPNIHDHLELSVSHSWDEDVAANGGYSMYVPGTLKTVGTCIGKPEGRIHFAGEHTAPFHLHATMQGALESGIRAAKEVHEKD